MYFRMGGRLHELPALPCPVDRRGFSPLRDQTQETACVVETKTFPGRGEVVLSPDTVLQPTYLKRQGGMIYGHKSIFNNLII
jgi:hypothetical protein